MAATILRAHFGRDIAGSSIITIVLGEVAVLENVEEASVLDGL